MTIKFTRSKIKLKAFLILVLYSFKYNKKRLNNYQNCNSTACDDVQKTLSGEEKSQPLTFTLTYSCDSQRKTNFFECNEWFFFISLSWENLLALSQFVHEIKLFFFTCIYANLSKNHHHYFFYSLSTSWERKILLSLHFFVHHIIFTFLNLSRAKNLTLNIFFHSEILKIKWFCRLLIIFLFN